MEGATTGRPEVVREVVERTTYYDRPVYRERSCTNARQWREQLSALIEQLADPGSTISREHFEHQRLDRLLWEARIALDRAHPGGLHRR